MPQILALPRAALPPLPLQSCWSFTDWATLPTPVWRERGEIEQDESLLQLIPYVVLRNTAGQLWTYARNGGDARLEGRRSCGVGGHVEICDQDADLHQTLIHTARREMAEELGLPEAKLPPLAPCALIYEAHSSIGRVHLGVLFIADWHDYPAPQPPAHESLHPIGFLAAASIAADERHELWSRLVAQFVRASDECNNTSQEATHDPTTSPATTRTSEHLAPATPGHCQPAGSLSSENHQLDTQLDGHRAGTCAPDVAGTTAEPDSTRPLDATRELATSQGQKTYSEVAVHLAVNIVHALENLLDTEPEQIVLSSDWIRNIHQQLAGKLFPEWAGCFRSTDVQVGTHFPPPPYDVPVQIRNYCLDLETRIKYLDTVESVAALLAWADWRFQWIHPFKDFNGRVGRILLVALCYKLNLPPANPAADDSSRMHYFSALRQADQGDFSALENIWRERLSQ